MRDLPPPAQRFKHPIGLAVHGLLWNEWDPIGINDFGPDDEYDGYVWPLIGKVMQGETPRQIAAYLDWATNEHMGCPPEPGRNLELALKLAALRPEA